MATLTTPSESTSTRFVSYLRVSSKAQGQSGLGIEAQRADVERFIAAAKGTQVKEFVEVESGKRADRPQLAVAIQWARRSRATLVVAKLDRLSRNVAFLATLMESGIDFVAVDNPHATKFTIHILAAVAEFEREMIVRRTKAALEQARQRGVQLGSRRSGHWDGHEDRRQEGARRGSGRAAVVNRHAANESYGDVTPTILEHRNAGLSLRQIASKLNDEGTLTRRGCRWTAHTVRMVLIRTGENPRAPKSTSVSGLDDCASGHPSLS